MGYRVMTEMGILKLDKGIFINDGIVPLSSAQFEGHDTKANRLFAPYNHTKIGEGNNGTNDFLFSALKSELILEKLRYLMIV